MRRLILAQGLRPVAVGLIAGLGAAAVLTRFLRALLYGMSPLDPVTMIVVPVLLIALAVAALLVPAVRATRIDPVRALRAD